MGAKKKIVKRAKKTTRRRKASVPTSAKWPEDTRAALGPSLIPVVDYIGNGARFTVNLSAPKRGKFVRALEVVRKMSPVPKLAIIRDRKYLAHLKTQRCLITGAYGSESEGIDPMHIGTAGRGLKSPDNEALPITHALHRRAHSHGEISMLREFAPDDLLRAAFRALARERYDGWKKNGGGA